MNLGSSALLLYFHTLRHLRPGQVFAQLARRLHRSRPLGSAEPLSWRKREILASFLEPVSAESSSDTLTFIGLSRPFDTYHPDWVQTDVPKLWRYNLHYFDYLHWPSFDPATKASLIDSWISDVPAGAEDAWEPYPASLRIVNWLKCFHTLPSPPPPAWLASLSQQVAALDADIEYHLLANHLLKNGKALVFAGACCEGPAAARYLARGLKIVLAEADEQVLPDGGHFERSPMYHCIVLEDYLDLVNLLGGNPGLVSLEVLERLDATARRAATYLAGICGGNGDIPLFNDAAHGITPPALDVLAYAERVLGPLARPSEGGRRRICFPDTGVYGYRQDGDSLIIDAGPVGPDYQPGHAHCDTLSYELYVGGMPVIVDSGTFDYEAGPFRHYLRSTAAHNTVRIDGEEQSEIWGAFRVARRARPRAVSLNDQRDGGLVFAGEHDGYRRLSGRPVHRRTIRIESADGPGSRWRFHDVVSGRGRHEVESFIHLHPEVQVEEMGEREFRLRAAGGIVIRLGVEPVGEISWVSGYYCPAFGRRFENRVLVIHHRGTLPIQLGYSLERLA
ncbi:MAG: alginate lyase family protein [Caldilineaceae bacterium]|nr:alginate lyase family protein [Caldilineaceae bacterium]